MSSSRTTFGLLQDIQLKLVDVIVILLAQLIYYSQNVSVEELTNLSCW